MSLFHNTELTAQIIRLFHEAKRFLLLEKRLVGLQAVEVLTRVLAAVALWAIIILLGTTALLFGGIAFAVWMGQVVGSYLLGFVIVAAVQLLLIALVYANRRRWLLEPTARFLVGVMLTGAAETAARAEEHKDGAISTADEG